MKLGIRHRIILVAVAPAILVTLLVTGVLMLSQWQGALDAQYRRIGALARQISAVAEFNLFAGNVGGLRRQLDLALAEPDISAAAFLDPQGAVIASTLPAASLPGPDDIIQGFSPPRFDLDDSRHWHSEPIRSTQTGDYDLFATPEGAQPIIGRLLIEVSTAGLRERVARDALSAGGLALLVLMIALALAAGLARGLVLTLGEIRSVVEGIARNRQRRHVMHTGPDELGQLAADINTMADVVTQTQDELVRRINDATQSLREERDAAAMAAESRSRFFAAASHDLRQPAQALGLFVTRLERDARNSTLLPRIRQLALSVKTLQAMLDELLDYSRLSGGVYRTEARPVQAAGLIDTLVEEFRAAAAERHLDLRARVTDCWLQTDPVLLKRLLINLVSNALRYTDHGGVLIACRAHRSHALIEVWDTGIGIPDDQIAHVFEELVQLGNPERDPGKGLGLGLSIVRRTADLLCHPLIVHSRVGRGSCFRLTVPLAEPPAAVQEALWPSERRLLLLGLPKPTINQIEDWEFQVTRADDTREALPQLARHGFPALVVADTKGNLAKLLVMLDAIDAAAGEALPTLILHEGPVPVSGLPPHRTLLSRPFRPARLRALLDHQLAHATPAGETFNAA